MSCADFSKLAVQLWDILNLDLFYSRCKCRAIKNDFVDLNDKKCKCGER